MERLQPRVKAALHEVMYAETREQAREAITRFATEFGVKYPKALTTLEKGADALFTFFDFPAEHCAPILSMASCRRHRGAAHGRSRRRAAV
jgi:transposase-like protein